MACFAGFVIGREAARLMLPRRKGKIFLPGATAALRGGTGYAAFASAKFFPIDASFQGRHLSSPPLSRSDGQKTRDGGDRGDRIGFFLGGKRLEPSIQRQHRKAVRHRPTR